MDIKRFQIYMIHDVASHHTLAGKYLCSSEKIGILQNAINEFLLRLFTLHWGSVAFDFQGLLITPGALDA